VRFKVHNEDKLQLLGQDAVAIVVSQLLETRKLEEFSHVLANIDLKDHLKKEIQFNHTFDLEQHHDQVLFYMVMYCTTLMKYNAIDYIKEKKFLGGYKEAPLKSFYFSKGLEAGLENFKGRGKFINIKSVIGEKNNNGYTYSTGSTLNKIPLPYFWFEHTKKSIEEITIDFATDIATLRQPNNPIIVVGVFYEKAKELIPLSHEILTHFFVD
jgi:hypothetical protein